jgi:hypothetical protein
MKKTLLLKCLLVLILAETSQRSLGIEPMPDKSRFNLLLPTPRELMREMSTDRPDKTESAYTVDAGHFQIESDLVTHSHDHDTRGGADTKADAWSIAVVNLKVGLLNNVDAQLVVESYNTSHTKDRLTGTSVHQCGFGDVTARLKVNCWGNDGGDTALSTMPFLKLPTNQDELGNDAVEAGIIFPFAASLPRGFGLGMMTEFDFNEDASGSGYHTEFVNTITLSHDLIGKLGGYIEFFSAVSTESGTRWVGTFDLGLTYALSEDIQLDCGVNIGVTDSADDVNPFLGLSWRF